MGRVRRGVVGAGAALLLGGLPLVAWAVTVQDGEAPAAVARSAGTADSSGPGSPSAQGPAAAADPADDGPKEAPSDEHATPASRVSPEQLLSPLTPDVVAHVREIAGRSNRKDDVFAKVGDSATENRAFMKCFSKASNVKLGKHSELKDTVEFFRKGRAGYSDPYRRDSEASSVGWSTWHVLKGRPSPLLKEVRAISPRFALVMLGTNELKNEDLGGYGRRLGQIVDALSKRGVIPILYTVPPRNDDEAADALVPRYNLVVEAVARQRRVPWIDFHAGLVDLPKRGLASDGLHPGAPVKGGKSRGCYLTDFGLRFGQNLRNLLSLQMLDRLRKLVLDGEGEPDAPRRTVRGKGTEGSPFRIGSLPFSVWHSTKGADGDIDAYPSCDASKDESGPERVYRIELEEKTTLRAAAASWGRVDVDLHLLGSSVSGDSCIERADEELRRELEPGRYHLVVDTFAGHGRNRPGDYILVVDEPPGE